MYTSLRYFYNGTTRCIFHWSYAIAHYGIWPFMKCRTILQRTYFLKYPSNHIENSASNKSCSSLNRLFFLLTHSFLTHSSFFVPWCDMPFFSWMIVQLFVLSSPATNPRSLFSIWYIPTIIDEDFPIYEFHYKALFYRHTPVNGTSSTRQEYFYRYNLLDSIVLTGS